MIEAVKCAHCFHKDITFEENTDCRKGTKYKEIHIFRCCKCGVSEQAYNSYGDPIVFFKERKTTDE